MPEMLQAIDVAAFFVTPSFSKLAMAPTKLGEFLAMGIPCITNSGLGDTAEILVSHGVGVVVPDTSASELKRGAGNLLELLRDPSLSKRCRETARSCFSLEGGAQAYDRIYRQLTGKPRSVDLAAGQASTPH